MSTRRHPKWEHIPDSFFSLGLSDEQLGSKLGLAPRTLRHIRLSRGIKRMYRGEMSHISLPTPQAQRAAFTLFMDYLATIHAESKRRNEPLDIDQAMLIAREEMVSQLRRPGRVTDGRMEWGVGV